MADIKEAIAAIKAGDKETGRRLLAGILQADLDNELAWLWMAAVAESPEQRRKYLLRVLELNPDNASAKKGLAALDQKQAQTPKSSQPDPETQKSKTAGPLMARLAATQQAQEELLPIPKPREPEPDAPPDEVDETVDAEAEVIGEVGLNEPDVVEEDEEQDEEEYYDDDDDDEDDVEPEGDPLVESFNKPSESRTMFYATIGVVLFLCCAAVVIARLAFQPLSGTMSATVAAVVGTSTPTISPTPTDTPVPTGTPTNTPTATSTPTVIGTRVVADTPTTTPTVSRTPTPNPFLTTGQVVGIISGDEISVVIDGIETRVKYAAIAAPSLEQGEPFAQEAMEINRLLVEGKTVTLEEDEQDSDESGRLLRYVFADGVMINEELIRQGVARVDLQPPNTKYGSRFQEVERDTRVTGIGIWSNESAQATPEAGGDN